MLEKMKEILEDDNAQEVPYITNAFGIGQVNTTLLVEAYIEETDLDYDILDDPDHGVWDAAADAAEWFETLYGRPK